MKGYLCRGTNTEEDVAADEHGNRVGRGTDNASHDTKDTSADEERPAPKDVREATERSEEDG
jgi:hypothetical protein